MLIAAYFIGLVYYYFALLFAYGIADAENAEIETKWWARFVIGGLIWPVVLMIMIPIGTYYLCRSIIKRSIYLFKTAFPKKQKFLVQSEQNIEYREAIEELDKEFPT